MFFMRWVVIAACWAIAAGFSTPPSFISSISQHGRFEHRLETCTARPVARGKSFFLRMAAGMPLPPPPPPRKNEFLDEENEERRRRKSKAPAPEPQAGVWREELGLGLGRLSTTNQPNPKPKVRARDKKSRKAERPPPPMLTRKEWEAAAWIGGAKDVWELGMQFLMAKEGRFEEMEMDWVEKGASRREIMKRLGNARRVNTEAQAQEKRAEDPAAKAKSWAAGNKMARPPNGLFYRYMTKQVQEDGKVLAMSAPRASGVREEQFATGYDKYKLMSASKGGSDNQKRLAPGKRGGSGAEGGGGMGRRLGAAPRGGGGRLGRGGGAGAGGAGKR